MKYPLLLLAAVVGICSPLAAQSLSKQIDRRINERLAKDKVPASPLADDAEFLRRVYLDLTGRIPTYDQAAAFLNSTEPDRRAKLIDELLARPEFGWHFGNHWRELIVDRGAENIGQAREHSWAFVDWLAERFNKDQGWDLTVREILTAEGEAKTTPPTTFVLVNRMGVYPKPEDQVGMASRLFMGLSLRCAQCHDHPYVETWKQDDFWGLAAFFAQVRDHNLGNDGSAQKPVYHEKPLEDAKRAKSYAGGQKRNGIIPPEPGPQIAIPKIGDPNSAAKVVKAKFFHGAEPKLDDNGPFRPAFAEWLTGADNPFFAKATVNRIWAHFFARGIIHPIDDIRPDQSGTHPELLDEMIKEFKASRFQIKPIVRAICNSETYQRSSKPLKDNKSDDKLFSHQALKLLSSDQVIDALAIAMGRPPATGKNRDQITAPYASRKADGDPTEYSHGIQQSLLLMNGGNSKEVPQSFAKMINGKSKEEAVGNLYLAVLSRRPRPDELQRVVSFVNQGDANQGYRDLYWVLLNSAEFIFNR